MEAIIQACIDLEYTAFTTILQKAPHLANCNRVIEAVIKTDDWVFMSALLAIRDPLIDLDAATNYALSHGCWSLADQIVVHSPPNTKFRRSCETAASHNRHVILDNMLTKSGSVINRIGESLFNRINEDTMLVFLEHTSDLALIANQLLANVCKRGWERVFAVIRPHLHNQHDFSKLVNPHSQPINELLVQWLNPDYRSLLVAVYAHCKYFGFCNLGPLIRRLPPNYSENVITVYARMLLNTSTNKHRKFPPDELIWEFIDDFVRTRWIAKLDPPIRDRWLARIAGTEFASQVAQFIEPPIHWTAACRLAGIVFLTNLNFGGTIRYEYNNNVAPSHLAIYDR